MDYRWLHHFRSKNFSHRFWEKAKWSWRFNFKKKIYDISFWSILCVRAFIERCGFFSFLLSSERIDSNDILKPLNRYHYRYFRKEVWKCTDSDSNFILPFLRAWSSVFCCMTNNNTAILSSDINQCWSRIWKEKSA